MSSVKDFALLLFLQQPEAGSGGIGVFMPMTIMIVIFYFLLVRPQQNRIRKAQLEREQFLNTLKLGDKIITSAGIYGTIVAMRGSIVHLEVTPSVLLTVMRNSIAEKAAVDGDHSGLAEIQPGGRDFSR